MKKKMVKKMVLVEQRVMEDVYSISELSPEAKERAIADRRVADEPDFWGWADEYKRSFRRMGESLGFNVVDYCYDLGGSSYTQLELEDEDLALMDFRRTMAYVYNNWISPYLGVHREYTDGGKATLKRDKDDLRKMGFKKYRFEDMWWCPFSGDGADYVLLDAYRDFCANWKKRSPFKDGVKPVFDDFMTCLGRHMTKTIMDEAEYRESDEGIERELADEGILFLKDGSIAEIVEGKAA